VFLYYILISINVIVCIFFLVFHTNIYLRTLSSFHDEAFKKVYEIVGNVFSISFHLGQIDPCPIFSMDIYKDGL
jgi:hypothetical protein